MTELPKIADALKNETPSLREKILAGAAKLEGLNDLVALNALQRDGSRLHQKAKAAYKNLGMPVSEDEQITNVMGDVNVTQDESRRRTGLPGWVAALIAAGAAVAGAGAAGYILGDRPAPNPGGPDEPPAAYELRLPD